MTPQEKTQTNPRTEIGEYKEQAEKYRKRANKWSGVTVASCLGCLVGLINCQVLNYNCNQALAYRQHVHLFKPYEETMGTKQELVDMRSKIKDNGLYLILDKSADECHQYAQKIIEDNKDTFTEYERAGEEISSVYSHKSRVSGAISILLAFLSFIGIIQLDKNKAKEFNAQANAKRIIKDMIGSQ